MPVIATKPGFPVILPVEPGALAKVLLKLGGIAPFNRGTFRRFTTRTVLSAAGGALRAKFRGATFIISDADHPTECAILLNPRYNAPEIDFLADAVGAGGVAVDIGSNIGLYTLPIAIKAGGSGRVLAIDASRIFSARLAINAAASGLTNIVQVVGAVGDHTGTAMLALTPNNPGTASLVNGHGEVVPMETLIDILARNDVTKIDAMKVDIDGSEDIALLPFLAAAPMSLLPKRMVMEHIALTSGSLLPGALARAGYVEVGRTKSNSLYERRA